MNKGYAARKPKLSSHLLAIKVRRHRGVFWERDGLQDCQHVLPSSGICYKTISILDAFPSIDLANAGVLRGPDVFIRAEIGTGLR